MDEKFLRRLHVISLIFVLMALGGGLRLFYLQIVRNQHYKVLANQEQLRKFEVASQRGSIYLTDRGGKIPVALNRELKRVYADPRFIENIEDTAKRIAEITHDDAAKYAEAMRTQSFYVVLKKQLDVPTAKAIDDLGLPGIGLQDEPVRVYPEGTLAAHVLGFVNADGAGQYGIEEYFNQELAGQSGLLKATTDTRGIPIATSENFQIQPEQGSEVVLTIDRNLQAKVEQVLADGVSKYRAKSASAVVMDPNSGAILALANQPNFNPADFAKVTDYSIFSNRAASSLYEPGSIFKVFSMSAGLDTGAVTPTTTFANTGSVQIDDKTIQNAQGIPNGTFTMSQVISKSINTGAVYVLQALGGGAINAQAKERLYSYYHDRFLFGQTTSLEVPAEPAGTVQTTDASRVDYANMTFGQGIDATMVQVVAGYAAIANAGTVYQPYLVDHVIRPNGDVIKTQPKARTTSVISKTTSDQLKAMMETVVQEGGGFGTKIAGYRIGGKTGTAQIPNPAGGYFENRDIGSFAGFAPLEQPQFVMLVRIDEPKIGGFAGSAAAGPMFGDIMRWLLNYRGVPPSG
ncbi:penicillin-binding protein 2 [Candidatus Microgenomates bacterium]|nr:penicillin-binding protein 2 [Candidatus Microgenomates bacterium]